jgi:glucose/arabinose dehydrogenase
MAQPVRYWTPSPALTGIAFYDGTRFPRWRGDLLMGTLKSNAIIRVRLDGDRVREDEFLLKKEVPRVRHVAVGPDGYVYLLTDESRGAILRLEPAD